MTLAELIQVLEAAKKGSVGLDRLICETVAAVIPGRGDDCFWGFKPAAGTGGLIELDAPSAALPFTTSIDAALELIPEGWSWNLRVLQRSGRPTPPMVRICV